MKVTRRKLAGILTAAVLAKAQAPPAPAKPTSDQDLTQAKQGLRSNALEIARIPMLMAVEPAFRFKA